MKRRRSIVKDSSDYYWKRILDNYADEYGANSNTALAKTPSVSTYPETVRRVEITKKSISHEKILQYEKQKSKNNSLINNRKSNRFHSRNLADENNSKSLIEPSRLSIVKHRFAQNHVHKQRNSHHRDAAQNKRGDSLDSFNKLKHKDLNKEKNLKNHSKFISHKKKPNSSKNSDESYIPKLRRMQLRRNKKMN